MGQGEGLEGSKPSLHCADVATEAQKEVRTCLRPQVLCWQEPGIQDSSLSLTGLELNLHLLSPLFLPPLHLGQLTTPVSSSSS